MCLQVCLQTSMLSHSTDYQRRWEGHQRRGLPTSLPITHHRWAWSQSLPSHSLVPTTEASPCWLLPCASVDRQAEETTKSAGERIKKTKSPDGSFAGLTLQDSEKRGSNTSPLTPTLRLSRPFGKEKVNIAQGKPCMIPTIYKGGRERGQGRTDFPGEELQWEQISWMEPAHVWTGRASMGGPRKWTSEGIDRLSASTNRYPAYFRLLRGDCSQMPGKKSQELKHFLQVLVLEGSA